jgi:hypothetical protein
MRAAGDLVIVVVPHGSKERSSTSVTREGEIPRLIMRGRGEVSTVRSLLHSATARPGVSDNQRPPASRKGAEGLLTAISNS